MVGQVGNARPVGGDPVTDRGSWMDDVLGNDLEAADAYRLLGRVMQHDASVEVADPDREERRREIACEASPQVHRRGGRAPNMDLAGGPKERGKEAEALDVVHVEVGQEDVQPLDGRVDGGSEPADAGPGIEREDGAIGAHDLDRGGVAPVARRFRAGAGERPAGPPQADDHRVGGSQNIARPPRS